VRRFVPSAFLWNLRLFFRQFAVTIAASTVISCFVSLTLSPALCAALFKDHDPQSVSSSARWSTSSHGFGWFNGGFERLSKGMESDPPAGARVAIVLVIYVALVGVAGLESGERRQVSFRSRTRGTHHHRSASSGATLARTEELMKQATDIILNTRGIEHVAPFAGLDATTST